MGNVGNAKFEGGLRFWVCFAVRALRSLGLGGLGAWGAPPPEMNVLGLLFSHRRAPSCRRHAFRAEKEVGASLRPLPCPVGARGAAGVRIRRCLPLRGKSAAEGRAGFWPVHGKEFFAGAFCPLGNFPGAPGKRSCGAHLIAFAFRGEYSGRGIRSRPVFPPLPPFRARKRPSSRPPRRASFPRPSRGETGGLCPHPLKGPDP